ncbi:MAG: TRAP transporter substrate-binding protein [Gammaproteobacteria bacterium]|nr:TRAP transporter substrate-binding protein [Gammaproteobacteria bacterium]MDH4316512.1 TRAP transporter substrate-binding protein [Gammaproteobacteria bacterium]MDH5215554.1 TRAP transporter substrate-binding protein [Gammaproteobacteria bacterium]
MKRREFVGGLAVAAGLGACGEEPSGDCEATAGNSQSFRWNMVTSWPPGLPGLGTGAENFAADVARASAGRLRIKVFAGGELVPALEVFDAVSRGAAQMGHDPSYYHRGKVPSAQFFTAIPFGQNANEINAWVYFGGGLELWQELYAEFNLIPFPVGQTGVQMAGWFNKEINSVADLRGLKMRIPGLGGEVMQRAGVTQVTVPASEIFTSLQTGAIDAAEWVGPYNDVSLGLHRVAKYYYYPGWHEPGPMIECIINKEAWNTLPVDLQEIVKVCCRAANLDCQAEYTYGNAMALDQLKADPNVEIRRLPDDVLELLQKYSGEVMQELAAKDPWSARIKKSFDEFQIKSIANQQISEQAFLNARTRESS